MFSITPVVKSCRLLADRATKPENFRTVTRWRWIPKVTSMWPRLVWVTKRVIGCRNSRWWEIIKKCRVLALGLTSNIVCEADSTTNCNAETNFIDTPEITGVRVTRIGNLLFECSNCAASRLDCSDIRKSPSQKD